MNYSYKKMYNKNYMIIDGFLEPIITEDYKLEMLRRNTIDGLLEMQLSIEDNLPSYYYEISGKQSFHSYFYDNKIRKDQIISFLNGLYKLLTNLNKFLLDYNHIVLSPQCVYFDKSMDHFYFTYCPSHSADFFDALKEYIAYLLTITDHNDEQTVLVAYGLFHETENSTFNIKSLLSIIEKFTPAGPQENIAITPPETPAFKEPDNNILKEPDILLKDNYVYDTTFLIKNGIVYGGCIIAFFANIIMKFLSIYSTEGFFIIMLVIIISCIFYTSKTMREAPLHRMYEKQEPIVNKNIIRINTDISIPAEPNTEATFDDNCETVLLCQNPKFTNHHLIYTGIDYSSDTLIEQYPFTIGKNNSNNLVINNPMISRSHARIIKENNKIYIEDLNSSNGTKVNDCIIDSYTPTELNNGDTISFADLTYIFQ